MDDPLLQIAIGPRNRNGRRLTGEAPTAMADRIGAEAEVEVGRPRVVHRETVRRPARFAKVKITVGPIGTPYALVDAFRADRIPREHIPAVDEGCREAARRPRRRGDDRYPRDPPRRCLPRGRRGLAEAARRPGATAVEALVPLAGMLGYVAGVCARHLRDSSRLPCRGSRDHRSVPRKRREKILRFIRDRTYSVARVRFHARYK
ncbi:hypothetical protein ACSNOI_43305 [Actinomadura kijaniata]|uniref:hypothetical protein n=1 Tax=Actinomadura kijaniata TaxID=46161 RepID=UPI003F19FF7F